MQLKLFQKKLGVLDDLVSQAELVEEAAAVFLKLCDDFAHLPQYAKQLEVIEHNADNIVHAIDIKLTKIFILPSFEKEDVQRLMEFLDDVIDYLEETANRTAAFRLPAPTAELRSFAELLALAAVQIRHGITLLRQNRYRSQEFVACYQELHALENKGDKVHRGTLLLMNNETIDLRTTMKWKVVYDNLENALDTCEDVAIAFEHIRVKYS